MVSELKRLIDTAAGRRQADLLLRNARVVNVLTGEVIPGDVALCGARIAGIGDYDATDTVDLRGRFLVPAFVDAHVHVESAMVSVAEYAAAVVPRGTTAIVIDPHEIANVLGAEGVRYMLAAGRAAPLDVYTMVPSCVPATHLETAGACLRAADIAELLDEPGVLGLGEMMNFPGVLDTDPEILARLATARGRPVDGHAPGLAGRRLTAYAAAGIGSDHECTTAEEALEKARLGMTVMVREGTGARNLEALLPAITPANAGCFVFCTDDRHPGDLLGDGHIDYLLRKAVRLGLDPVCALRMASLNAARHFGFRNRGAVCPGWRADLAVVDDLAEFNVSLVVRKGRVVARDGRMVAPPPASDRLSPPRNSIRLTPLSQLDLAVPAEGTERIRVIDVVPGQIVTGESVADAPREGGFLVSQPARDLLKIVVCERHTGRGGRGLAFVRGFGLRCGAIASSVAHDSHNIIAVGAADVDMVAAINEVIRLQGGMVVAEGGRIVAALALPIAGLMSDRPMAAVRDGIEQLNAAAQRLGCGLADPFMALSFLALPVIPHLKITDRGLVDVDRFEHVPLTIDAY